MPPDSEALPDVQIQAIDARDAAFILVVNRDGQADLNAHVPPASVLKALRDYTAAFAAKHGLS